VGYDIVAFIEYPWPSAEVAPQPTDLPFFCFAQVMWERDYDMFALLGGIRDEAKRVFPLRGLPSQLSAEADMKHIVDALFGVMAPRALSTSSAGFALRAYRSSRQQHLRHLMPCSRRWSACRRERD